MDLTLTAGFSAGVFHIVAECNIFPKDGSSKHLCREMWPICAFWIQTAIYQKV